MVCGIYRNQKNYISAKIELLYSYISNNHFTSTVNGMACSLTLFRVLCHWRGSNPVCRCGMIASQCRGCCCFPRLLATRALDGSGRLVFTTMETLLQ